MRVQRGPEAMKPDDPQCRILVVRPGALGDTILGIPLLKSISERNPGASLTVLGTGRYRFLIPRVMEFHPIDHRDWLWLFSPGISEPERDLPRYDKAYLVVTQPDRVAENLRNTGTESVVHVPSRPSGSIHVVEHLHLGLGLPIPPPGAVLAHLGPGEGKPLIWLHPGSGGPKKCVPPDRMLMLAQRLRDISGWDLAVTAGEEDEFLKVHPAWEPLINGPHTQLLDNRPYGELCETLGAAGLFVGNDSGISHLAANLGIPSAVFFVATDPAQWAPWVPEDHLRVIDIREREPEPHALGQEAENLLLWAGGIH